MKQNLDVSRAFISFATNTNGNNKELKRYSISTVLYRDPVDPNIYNFFNKKTGGLVLAFRSSKEPVLHNHERLNYEYDYINLYKLQESFDNNEDPYVETIELRESPFEPCEDCIDKIRIKDDFFLMDDDWIHFINNT